MTGAAAGRGAQPAYAVRLAGHLRRRGRVVALAAGAALPLAYEPVGWFPLAPLMLCILYACLDGVSAREAALRGFAFGFGSFLAGIHWIYISLHVFG